jgi:hypothetical protein
MKSELWDKNSTKAFTTGYSTEELDFFDKECEDFLTVVINLSKTQNNKFDVKSRELKKANWLILNDISCSLYDCLSELKKGNIRIAGRVFRDVLENMHLLELLNKSDDGKLLEKWFDNEFIPHRTYRDWLKKKDEKFATLTRDVYQLYSQFSHRNFKPISESYNTNQNGNLEHKWHLDRKNSNDLKISSKYYSHLSYFVFNSSLNYGDYKILNSFELSVMANEALKNVETEK